MYRKLTVQTPKIKNHTFVKRCFTRERNQKRAKLLDVLQAEVIHYFYSIRQHLPVPVQLHWKFVVVFMWH